MAEVMSLYMEHATTLRSPETARHHAYRIGPWAEGYRASQAREMAAHIVRDMREAYAPATINRSLGTLKKALSLAWDRGLTPENYGLRIKRLRENNAREVYLTVAEVRRVAAYCTEPMQALVWAALLTGARRGELIKLRAQDIKEDTITIASSHTKTERPRVVPIIDALRPWLKYFPVETDIEGIKSAWRRARIKAGMPHVNFHDLRHSCASILIELGVDLYTVGTILGHTSTNTTQRYAHLKVEQQRSALNKLSALV